MAGQRKKQGSLTSNQSEEAVYEDRNVFLVEVRTLGAGRSDSWILQLGSKFLIIKNN